MKKIIMICTLFILVCSAFAEWKVDEGFEEGVIPQNWTVYDGDDGSTWSAFENAGYAHSGSWMAFSDSYDNGQDNWLILPQTSIDLGDELSLYARAWYGSEIFEICVSVDDNDINDFDDVLIEVDDLEDEYTLYDYDLSEYQGQQIYIGIHWICDTYSLLIDDVRLGQAGAANTPPEINLPPEFSFDENSSLTVDFSQYVYDAQGDQLTISYSDNNEVDVTVSNMQVTFTGQTDWFGEDVMMFYVDDGEFTASDFITIVVNEVSGNTPPQINLPNEISFDENSSITVDFAQYITDAEQDPITLTVTDNNQVNVDITDLSVVFSAQEDWFGDDVMMFHVSDGEFTDSDFLTVVVNEIAGNTPPEIDLPDEFSFMENNSLTVDFSDYVYDADQDILTLTVSSNNEVDVSINNLEVTFSAEPGWFGEDIMMFEVSDGAESSSDFTTVIVTEAPQPGWKIDEDFEDGIIPSDWTVYDGDDGSTWTAYENAGYAHSGSWIAFSESFDSGQDNWLILPQTPIAFGDELSLYARAWYGSEIFEICVSVDDNDINDFDDVLIEVDDLEDEYTLYSFDLSEYQGQQIYVGIHWICDTYSLLVDDVRLGQEPGGNTPPEIFLPDSFTMDEDTSITIDFSEYISDEQGDELTISAAGNVNIATTISGMAVAFTPVADWFGEETITFTVDDGEYSASDEVIVIVVDTPDHLLGDVDDNTLIEAYDASLILQYVVGFDPAPAAPLPWEDWRITCADVDGSNNVAAYDAALILQYIVGVINQFPVENGERCYAEAQLNAHLSDNIITFTASGDLLSLDIELPYKFQVVNSCSSALIAVNHNTGKIAMAAPYGMVGNILQVAVIDDIVLFKPEDISLTLNGNPSVINSDAAYPAEDLPQVTSLTGNYPNPFNPETTIDFAIAQNDAGMLCIYNIKGELVHKCNFSAGTHSYQWNAQGVASGIYYYRLKTNNCDLVKKMTLLK